MPSLSPSVVIMLPVLLTVGTCSGIASAQQVTYEFTDSGQLLGGVESRSWSVALGDIDDDGDLDAIVANWDNNPNAIWINDGTGSFTDSGQTLGNSDNSYSAALGDLDGDGDLDVMVANVNEPNTVWINDGNGNFNNTGQLGNSGSVSVALGDIDGDGDLDAVFANGGIVSEPNTAWMNDGDGNFIDSGQAFGNGQSTSIGLADLDGDGDLDAMVANGGFSGSGANPNTIWFNNGFGNFVDSGQQLGNGISWRLALGDLDGDGDIDAMVANGGFAPEPNTMWTNDGTGIFTDSGQALGNSSTFGIALGDFDGDGDLDAMAANDGQPNTAWTNDGTGTFSNSGQALGFTKSRSVALGDLDGDGDLDAYEANDRKNAQTPNAPNTVWTNTVTGTGVCCTPSGCALVTENIAGICVQLGGVFIPQGDCDDCPTSCPGDIDGDGEVGGQDLALLLGAWGVCP